MRGNERTAYHPLSDVEHSRLSGSNGRRFRLKVHQQPPVLQTFHRTGNGPAAITDADRLRREKAKMNTRELWREVVGQLAKLQTAHSDMEPAFLQEELGNEFAAIVQAFTILGAKRMEELGYSRSKIEAAMTRTEENVLLTAPKMQEAVYAQYKTGDLVACSEINNFLHRLIVNNGIPFEGRRVDRKVVKLFFEIEDDTKRLGGQKAFLLGKKMFEF